MELFHSLPHSGGRQTASALATTLTDAFPFMGERCARLSDAVMALLENEELPHSR